ncbi:MAG: riboflavin synthase, partial [Dehalococcoidia bacterium]
AMAAGDRFHGHVVQGHVETVGRVKAMTRVGEDVRLVVTLDPHWLRYGIPKGSIALEGVSLTIADLSPEGLSVALIPFTLTHTTLGTKQVGDTVNVETDLFARMLERFLESRLGARTQDIDVTKLYNWGYGVH